MIDLLIAYLVLDIKFFIFVQFGRFIFFALDDHIRFEVGFYVCRLSSVYEQRARVRFDVLKNHHHFVLAQHARFRLIQFKFE